MEILKTHQRRRAAETLTLLVLVPHRDARLPLRAWSAALFAAGVAGAWSFPWAAPVAVLSRPLSAEELRDRARALRDFSLAETGGGKIKTGPAARAAFPGSVLGGAAIFGPVLDIPAGLFSAEASEKIIRPVSPPVLGAALVWDSGAAEYPAPPALSFRAAALANMIYRPLGSGGVSFEWKIGKPHWLPPVKNSGRRAAPARETE
jgi:hypothetical protein